MGYRRELDLKIFQALPGAKVQHRECFSPDPYSEAHIRHPL
jgi:hypothetical protein